MKNNKEVLEGEEMVEEVEDGKEEEIVYSKSTGRDSVDPR